MTRTAGLAALATAALLAAGCGSVGRTEGGDVTLGKRLFTEQCGQCHTLADAGTQGTVGPNLDDAYSSVRGPNHEFDESTLRDVIRGQIAYPVESPPTGMPGMPANLVTGEDADAVAAYVAAVAGTDEQVQGPAEAAGDAESTDGRTIFGSACASCHTLADADATGTIGPDLDETQPSRQLAEDRVRNGKGAMPAFEGNLSDEQIEAVAEYVAGAAGAR